jgi:hypothetical protein
MDIVVDDHTVQYSSGAVINSTVGVDEIKRYHPTRSFNGTQTSTIG